MRKLVVKGVIAITLLVVVLMCANTNNVNADQTKTLTGDEYQFTDSEKYNIDEKTPVGKTSSAASNSFGTLSITGDYDVMEKQSGYRAFDVKKGNIRIKYDFEKSKLITNDNAYNLYDDSCEEINGYDMDKDVDFGAILVQTSFDGQKWATDTALTNVFVQNSPLSDHIYETNNIQLVNGCYYRIIVAYEERKKTGETDYFVTTVDEHDYRRWAEVYTFYAINSEESKKSPSPSDTPRKELGTKIKTERNAGYSGMLQIDASDPHLGWDIGTFVINGYTSETTDSNGDPIFLKKINDKDEDKVTLWFNLKQDINCLNGNKDYKIESNNGAYDQYFEVPKTDFKRGTLIIRFTDHEGKKTNPIIYTNYLEANTRTGAYTKVELFEEGDYEVALDYSIDDSSTIVSKNKDYRIFFKFSIRNGNCMVFPFDTKTQNELDNYSITSNGFELNLAKSRYLDINVKRSELTKNNGLYVEDGRFNGPAKDGEVYNEEGIYRFTVKNKYTGESTEKTIYVGTSPIYKAMIMYKNDLSEINRLLAEGGEILDNGKIVIPVIEPEVTEPITTSENTDNKKSESQKDASNTDAYDSTDNNGKFDSKADESDNDGAPVGLIVAIVVIVLGGAAFAWFYITKIKTKNDGTVVVAAPQPVIEKLNEIEMDKQKDLNNSFDASNNNTEENVDTDKEE
ncbi:MAG: hypothetical protein IKN95_00360 [Lachnospiraceae bacterium]|nr:hypothetical protein [Lachnospiraceae bacterium]